MEDGTGEALVLCKNQHVGAMLGLSLLEWEALQNCVQSRGRVTIQHGEATGTGVSGCCGSDCSVLGWRLSWTGFPLALGIPVTPCLATHLSFLSV